jgi:hypothetical protein
LLSSATDFVSCLLSVRPHRWSRSDVPGRTGCRQHESVHTETIRPLGRNCLQPLVLCLFWPKDSITKIKAGATLAVIAADSASLAMQLSALIFDFSVLG